MENTFREIWPEGLVPSLWNDNLLKEERAPDISFSGLTFNWNFMIALAIGSIIIMIFAWRRFREHSYDQKSLDYRVMQHLAPTDLRARSPMGRAYFVYVFCILFVYLSLSLFGELIFKLVNMTPVAGIQMDTSKVDLDNPSWPLTIAFGFAGFLPLFRILQVPEQLLRIATHQLVGIPTRIEAHTRNFISKLQSGDYYEKIPTLGLDAKDGGKPAPEQVPAWIQTHFGVTEDPLKFYNRRDEIELMVSWLKEERIGNWPEPGIRQKLSPLQQELMNEAVTLLGEFESIIVQDYAKPSEESIARHKQKDTDAVAAHQQMLRKKFRDTIENMEKLRDELASLLTVYAERDSDFNAVLSPDLRSLLRETFPEVQAAPGLERNLAFTIFFLVGGAYAILVWQNLHPTLNWARPSGPLIFWTATVETLKIASLFLFPIIAVMYWRFFLLDRQAHTGPESALTKGRQWTALFPPRFSYGAVSQIVRIVLISGLVSIICTTGIAFLSTVLIAEDSRKLYYFFIEQPMPISLYYLQFSVIGVLQAFFAVLVVEWARVPKQNSSIAVGIVALASAMLTVGLYYYLNATWFSYWDNDKLFTYSCTQETYAENYQYLSDLFTRASDGTKGFSACFREYFIFDYIVCAILPILTIVFAWKQADRGKPRIPQIRQSQATNAVSGSPAMIAIIAFSLAILVPLSAQADEKRINILLGFRADAEPFSYRIETGEGRVQYIGYIADLCHYIFNSSDYVVHETTVTAATRKERLKPKSNGEPKYFDPLTEDPNKALVDVICDPITVRYQRSANQNDIGYDGIFSPIVFTSGVSYLEREGKNGKLGTTYLGYVDNTTAEEVVKRACEIDLFKVFERADKDVRDKMSREDRCDFDKQRHVKDELADCSSRSASNGDDTPKPAADESAPTEAKTGEKPDPRYIFCPMNLHTDAINWFCSDRDDRPHRIYFGDRDIILAKLRAWRQSGRSCASDEIWEKDKAYSYEPYALLVSKNDPDLLQHVQRRIFEFFSHSGKAKGLFKTYFPSQQFSQPLAYLFLLNAVDQEHHYSNPGKFDPQNKPKSDPPAETGEEVANQ